MAISPGLNAQGTDINTHLPVIPSKRPIYILKKLLPEDETSNLARMYREMSILHENWEASRHHLCFLPVDHNKSEIASWKEIVHTSGTMSTMAAIQGMHSLIAWFWQPAGIALTGPTRQ